MTTAPEPPVDKTDVLLVCTPSVLGRLEVIDAGDGHLPPWVDRARVSDEQLRAARTLRIVTGGDTGSDGISHGDLMTRIRGLGFVNERLQVSAIESLEQRVADRAWSAAQKQREDDERALRWKRAVRNAEETLATEDAVSDGLPAIASFAEEMDEEQDGEDWLVSGLIPVDGRVVIGGFRKAGKTVLALNLTASLVTGDPFLGSFEVRPPDSARTTVWLNLELTRRTARRWVHGIGGWVETDALKRIVGVHARGAVSAYAVTSRTGEYALEKLLTETAAETLVVDPVAPLMAVCGLDVNKGQDVGRFLTLMDRITHRVGVPQVVYTAHVGKASAQDDGNETVKGDTRWEDSVDSIIILGKERNSGTRWIRAEGRDIELDNATLLFDEEARRLTLSSVTRYEAELRTCAEQVLQVVRASPGILTEALLGDVRIVGTKLKRKAGVQRAVELGWVDKRPGQRSGVEHWPLV